MSVELFTGEESPVASCAQPKKLFSKLSATELARRLNLSQSPRRKLQLQPQISRGPCSIEKFDVCLLYST